MAMAMKARSAPPRHREAMRRASSSSPVLAVVTLNAGNGSISVSSAALSRRDGTGRHPPIECAEPADGATPRNCGHSTASRILASLRSIARNVRAFSAGPFAIGAAAPVRHPGPGRGRASRIRSCSWPRRRIPSGVVRAVNSNHCKCEDISGLARRSASNTRAGQPEPDLQAIARALTLSQQCDRSPLPSSPRFDPLRAARAHAVARSSSPLRTPR